MIVFTLQEHSKLFLEPFISAGCKIGKFKEKTFLNQEMSFSILDEVKGQKCLIIASISLPAENLLKVALLADALKRCGAKNVQLFLPYFAFSRQDKIEPCGSVGIELISKILKCSGVDKIITIDLHSELDKELIDLPVKSFSPATVFAPEVLALNWKDFTVVAPDEGATKRAQDLAKTVGQKNVAYFTKTHSNATVRSELHGDIKGDVILVDDILDSGRTLVSACKILHSKGAPKIVIIATHGLFNGDLWKELFGLGVQKILVGNTCQEAVKIRHPKLSQVQLQEVVLPQS